MMLSKENQPSDICDAIGTAMMFVGGASGVFHGTMFKAAARKIEDKEVLSVYDFADMWEVALAALMEKG